jgi:hypothetical protein
MIAKIQISLSWPVAGGGTLLKSTSFPSLIHFVLLSLALVCLKPHLPHAHKNCFSLSPASMCVCVCVCGRGQVFSPRWPLATTQHNVSNVPIILYHLYYLHIPHILPDRGVHNNHSSMICECCVYRCYSQVIIYI